MIRPSRIATALPLGLLACRESAGPNSGAGEFTLQVAVSAGTVALDSGYVRVTGPTSKPRAVRLVVGGIAAVGAEALLLGGGGGEEATTGGITITFPNP